MGYVDIFRKLWGWLSGETGVVEFGSTSDDRVNFLSTTDGTDILGSTNDRVNYKQPMNDEIDF
jgi:hypothetical protein